MSVNHIYIYDIHRKKYIFLPITRLLRLRLIKLRICDIATFVRDIVAPNKIKSHSLLKQSAVSALYNDGSASRSEKLLVTAVKSRAMFINRRGLS